MICCNEENLNKVVIDAIVVVIHYVLLFALVIVASLFCYMRGALTTGPGSQTSRLVHCFIDFDLTLSIS